VDFDLAIVGGGPAGVSTALFFAAAAPGRIERVVLLEKERYPRDKICAGAIGSRADRLLETIGVRVDVPSVPVRGLSVEARVGALAADAGEVIGRVVRRIEFDHAFADHARERGVRVIEGAKVDALTVDGRGVSLSTSQGEIRARAVVGADGVGSVVRRALGVPRGALRAQVVEVDTPAAALDRGRDVLHFDMTDLGLGGYAWDFATVVGGRPLVCRGVYAIHHEEAGRGASSRGRRGSTIASETTDVSARLVARLARLGISAEGLTLKRFAERGLSLHEPVARPRALLVGEAAGIDPVLGEGIAQAIQYGSVAGPYLARCLDRGDLSFADFRGELTRSRVGLDLGIRTRVLPWYYGPWSRAIMERWITGSESLAIAGMRYFAGSRVPRWLLVRAAVDLARAAGAEQLARAHEPPWNEGISGG
jgi:menaquinone-9 beta-reductase